MTRRKASAGKVTFLEQMAPIDEYGRALYAVARSVIRALLDSLSNEDLTDLNTPLKRVTMRQLAKVLRLDRDKGIMGDGFEWAVHEAILGGEPLVIEPVADAMKRASRFVSSGTPNSLLFGYERARHLGFLDAIVDQAGTEAFLLPEGSGRPYRFGPWVAKAARGKAAEPELTDRIKHIWKTDLFLACKDDDRYFAATVKSSVRYLEGGRGLRIGIVPEASKGGDEPGVTYNSNHGLWMVTLPDPNGFTGLFNDAYRAVGRAVCAIGKQSPPPYWTKPSAKAQRLQAQLERYPEVVVQEIEAGLNEAAQQDLVSTDTRLLGVNAPPWLHMKHMTLQLVAPRPRFEKLD